MQHNPAMPKPAMGRAASPTRILVPAALLLGAAGLVALVALMPAPKSETPASERPPVNVRAQRLAPLAELADTFELTAIVEPQRIVKVAAEVSGRIERIATRPRALVWRGAEFLEGTPLDEGQPVSAGDPLVFLNRELLDARFERSRAQFEFDEREFRRMQGLFEGGSTSRTELDDARTRYEVSKAALDEVAAERERATIVAPIDGILNKLPVEIGEYASPGDVVAEIVDTETVKVAVEIPERDIGYFKTGAAVDVSPIAEPDKWYRGKITYIDSVANAGTRTTRMEIAIDNRTGALRSGQIVRSRLTRRVLTDVIMIPLAAVIPLEQGYEVYVVDDGVAHRRSIEIGFVKGREVRVTKGLAAGEALIIEGQRFVSEGQAVRVVE
jgi:membrane fusion protein (multidrug efflux system)